MIRTHARFRSAPLLLATALALASGGALAQEDISKVNGGVSAEAGQTYRDLSTVNGGIRIGDGARLRNAETVNGGIRGGDGLQAEDMETVNGGINLGARAQVDTLTTVNGGIRLGTDARVGRHIESVSGGVFVDRGGRVGGNVGTVNGAIGLVDTDLGGGIETVNGDITVGVGSHVKGGIRIEKPKGNWGVRWGKPKVPRIVIGPDAVVDGELVFEREVTLYVHQSARIGNVSGATAQRYSTPTPPKD